MSTIAVTGHRPPDLGGYGYDVRNLLTGFAERSLAEMDVEEVVTGMAQGWDQAVAHACVRLSVPFTAALPFESMGRRWPSGAIRILDQLLSAADRVEIVGGDGAYRYRFIVRDRWMVDYAAAAGGSCLALWNGRESGGTFATLSYALRQGVPVTNLWDDWIRRYG